MTTSDFKKIPLDDATQNARGNSNISSQANDNPFKTSSFTEMMAKDYKANWLIDNIIERGDWGMIYGKSASCKSFFVQEACYCVATGVPFHGKTVQQSSVLYVAGEGFSGLKKRFVALVDHHGEFPSDTLHFSEQPADFMNAICAKNIADRVKEIGNIGLIVIDTLHRNMGSGSENSAEDIGKFLYNIDTHLKNDGIADFDITRLIIHHSGLGNDDRARGSGSIYAAMEVSYRVEKNNQNIVTIICDKMKNHPQPPSMSFSIKSVADSIVLELTDYAVINTSKLSDNAHKVLHEVSKAVLSDFAIPTPPEVIALFPDSPENAPKQVISFGKLRELVYAVLTVDSKDGDPDKILAAKKSAFRRARTDLIKFGWIGVYGSDYVWFAKKSAVDNTGA